MPASTDTETPTQFIYRHAALWERGDLDAVLADYHHDALVIVPTGHVLKGREAIAASLADFFARFQDVELRPQKIMALGDELAVEWIFACTDRATGRRGRVRGAAFISLRDGKIARWREYWDTHTLMRQFEGPEVA
jgi:steroid delta-isomerase-like uncharacterized protein